MNRPPQINPAARGFTLIEIMVVVVIIAIMSAVIVGEMSGTFHDAVLRSTSRQLISVFSVASSRAISLDRTQQVRFDRTTGRYALEMRRHGEFVPVDSIIDGEGTIDSRITLQIRGEGSEDAIAFHPDGTADEREIELRDSDGFGLALRVNPITSRVEVRELERQ
ncbi:MAG TPA: prepilin-type N-terminal cleavage/methylation domain-containing protein [Verrucomicrobiae bacterium]|jgi:prepilin-type N-terminal cleavage/methylation domain-containing protein|nr:prepilin-type N-terminal cleavage/methylation domain-containing protein [Verrucomicrobiae bacterium]